jgi:CheY-like chemotaxis protein
VEIIQKVKQHFRTIRRDFGWQPSLPASAAGQTTGGYRTCWASCRWTNPLTPISMIQQNETVILLVDDEPAILALCGAGLEREGFRVLKARTAAEALDRAKQLGRIDVLATDVVLPNQLRIAQSHWQRPTMHGVELMRRMLALQPDLKVILFSGQSEEMIKSVGGLPPGALFLRKPFSADTLARSIRRAISDVTRHKNRTVN